MGAIVFFPCICAVSRFPLLLALRASPRALSGLNGGNKSCAVHRQARNVTDAAAAAADVIITLQCAVRLCTQQEA